MGTFNIEAHAQTFMPDAYATARGTRDYAIGLLASASRDTPADRAVLADRIAKIEANYVRTLNRAAFGL